MDQEKMGKFLANLRKEKGLTQKEVGDHLGITDNSVSKWERGINAPDIYYLAPLSELYQVSIKEILKGERKKKTLKYRKENSQTVLEVSNLSKCYGKRKVLNHIHFTIQEGSIVGLIGPNGAGKTTLLKTILGLVHPQEGKIEICQIDVRKNFQEAMTKVSSIIEKPTFYEHLTGWQNIKITCALNHISDWAWVSSCIKSVKLESRIHDKVKKYSLGMKQRLAFCNAMIKRPKLLILDEPMNGLDPLGIKELREMIEKLNTDFQVSVLISSHILKELEELCNKFVIIDNGYIIDEIEEEELKELGKSLEEEFLKMTSGSFHQIGGQNEMD